MADLSRRRLIQTGLWGLAAAGATPLILRSDAAPTDATEDTHDYQKFLSDKGIPQVQPAGKWEPTGDDILGPYYLKSAPFRGKVTPPLEPGELLVMRGRIWGIDTKRPITNAVFDIWQANAKGSYDLTDPRKPPKRSGFRNRIRLVTDETGYYEYETIRPGSYRIGGGPKDFRPAHIHYMVQAPGYAKLITQLYFKGDRFNKTDRWASKSNLIIDPEKVRNANGAYQSGVFDIVLAKK
jgi:catechol 1,2-dioxygenase